MAGLLLPATGKKWVAISLTDWSLGIVVVLLVVRTVFLACPGHYQQQRPGGMGGGMGMMGAGALGLGGGLIGGMVLADVMDGDDCGGGDF